MFSFSGLTHQHGTACAPLGCCRTGTEFHRLHTCRFLEHNVQFLSEHSNVLITAQPASLTSEHYIQLTNLGQHQAFKKKVFKKPASFESHANGTKMGMSEVSRDLQRNKNMDHMEHGKSDIK